MSKSSKPRNAGFFDVLKLWVGTVEWGSPTNFEFDVYRHWSDPPVGDRVYKIHAENGEGWIGYHVDLPVVRRHSPAISGPYCDAASEVFGDDLSPSSWCSFEDFSEEVSRLTSIVNRARSAASQIGTPSSAPDLLLGLMSLKHLRYVHLPESLEDEGWVVYDRESVEDAAAQVLALVEEHFAVQEGERPSRLEALEATREHRLPEGVSPELAEQIVSDVRSWIEENSRPFVPMAATTGVPSFEWQLEVPSYSVKEVLSRNPAFARLGMSAITLRSRYAKEIAYATEVLVEALGLAGEPQPFEWASRELARRLGYPSPSWDREDPRMADYGVAYVGLAEWGDEGRARVLAKSDVISSLLRFGAGRATFAELCKRFKIAEVGLLADVLWASVQELKRSSRDVIVDPEEQHPDALVSIRDFVPPRHDC